MFNFCYLIGKKEGDAWFETFPSQPHVTRIIKFLIIDYQMNIF